MFHAPRCVKCGERLRKGERVIRQAALRYENRAVGMRVSGGEYIAHQRCLSRFPYVNHTRPYKCAICRKGVSKSEEWIVSLLKVSSMPQWDLIFTDRRAYLAQRNQHDQPITGTIPYLAHRACWDLAEPIKTYLKQR